MRPTILITHEMFRLVLGLLNDVQVAKEQLWYSDELNKGPSLLASVNVFPQTGFLN